MNEEWIYIKTADDWAQYKAKLDADRPHYHQNEPNRFPCNVQSARRDDPCTPGRVYYEHNFTYPTA